MGPEDDFAEKLAHMRRHGVGIVRSGARNSTRTAEVRHEHTGERVGTQTEHWDGRVDARAERVTVEVNPALKLKERTPDVPPRRKPG